MLVKSWNAGCWCPWAGNGIRIPPTPIQTLTQMHYMHLRKKHVQVMLSASLKNIQKKSCQLSILLRVSQNGTFYASKCIFSLAKTPQKSQMAAKSYKGDLFACLCHLRSKIHEGMTHEMENI